MVRSMPWKERALAAARGSALVAALAPSGAAPRGAPEDEDGTGTGIATAATTSEAESREDRTSSSPDDARAPLPLRLGPFDFDRPEGGAGDAPGVAGDALGVAGRRPPPPFPPLFHEAHDMLHLSNLIYVLAEVRALARAGGLRDPDRAARVLDVPLPLDAGRDVVAAEGEALGAALDDGRHEAARSALASLAARQRGTRASGDEGGSAAASTTPLAAATRIDCEAHDGNIECGVFDGMPWRGAAGQERERRPATASSVLTAVGDARSHEELVYAVGVNPAQERITVIFRGSQTKNDFITDAKIR